MTSFPATGACVYFNLPCYGLTENTLESAIDRESEYGISALEEDSRGYPMKSPLYTNSFAQLKAVFCPTATDFHKNSSVGDSPAVASFPQLMCCVNRMGENFPES